MSRDFVSCSRVVRPWRTTSKAPSANVAKMAASVTGSSGGESIITTSYSRRSCSNRLRMFREPSSSDGFGGTFPAGMRSNNPSRNGTRTSSRARSPARTSVRPTLESFPRYEAKRGMRKSPSSTATFAPLTAKVIAKFALVVDFPSPGILEVTTNTLGGLSTST